MARIGRNATVDVSFEIFVDKFVAWLPTRPTAGVEPDPTLYKLSGPGVQPFNMDIYGETADLLDIEAQLLLKEVVFTDNGAALNPEPTPDVETPPTQDELDSEQFFRDAFNAEFAAMETAILANIEARYDILNTTPIAFADVPKSDIKHLRQRL